MRTRIGHWLLVPFLCVFIFSAAGPATGKDKFLAMGTSDTSGVYFPVGEGICELINKGRLKHNVRCTNYSTGGSVYNIQAMASGELDLAITTSDLAYQAFMGQGLFEDFGPNTGLRSIASLYENPVAIIVKNDSGIEGFADLPGHTINVGNRGSGKREVAELLFKAMGWKVSDFKKISELSTSKMEKAFCDGEVDIIIQAMGIPAPFYDRITGQCNGKFINIPPDVIAKLISENPYFQVTAIPGGMYPHNPQPVQTVSNNAILITSERIHEESIKEVVEAVFTDIDKFKKYHPALHNSNVSSMVKGASIIPFHAGAEKYYRQKNMLNSN